MAWARYRHASVNSQDPRALGMCDRCGFTYQHGQLAFQHDWRGPRIQNLRMLVCPTCMDMPQQNGQRTIIIPADPVPILNPRLDPNMISGFGPQYGPNLISNSGFTTDDGWTLQFRASIFEGALNFSVDDTGDGRATTTAADTLTSGVYDVSFDVLYSTSTTTSFDITVGGTLGSVVIDQTYPTSYSLQITSAASTQTIVIVCLLGGPEAAISIDNFVVREVL